MNPMKSALAIAAALIFLTLSAPQGLGQPAQAPDPWTGTGGGTPGQVKKDITSFGFELDGSVLVRKNHVVFAPKKGEKRGLVHDDLLYIYPSQDEAKFHAIYFDNEGHTIRYKAAPFGKQDAVRLESEDPPTAMRFRADFILNPDGSLTAPFWMAAPGDTFKVYVTGKIHRKY